MKLSSALFVLVLAAGAVACKEQGSSPAKQETAAPTRVEITVVDSGYEPAQVKAQVGKPLTLVFTRKSESHCGEEVVFPAQNIKRTLPLNEPVEITFTPEATGTIGFACGMDMYKGSVLVVQ